MTTLDLLITKFNDMKKSLSESLDKGFKDAGMRAQATDDAFRAHRTNLINKPMIATPHKQAMPSPEEHAARAAMYADFMKPVQKDEVNTSDEGELNQSEKLEMSENGQWSLTKNKDSQGGMKFTDWHPDSSTGGHDYLNGYTAAHGKYTHHPASKHNGKFEVSYTANGSDKPKSLGVYGSKEEAVAARWKHHNSLKPGK